MLNQLVVSAVVVSEAVLRYSQDGNYKIYELMLDVAPSQADGVYTTIKAVSISGRDSDRGSAIEGLKPDDIVLVEGSLRIEKVQSPDGTNKNIPSIAIDNVTVLKSAPVEIPPDGIEDTFLINRLTVTGRPGGDPEVKYFESGSVVANLSLAVDRPVKDETDWIPVAMWGGTAETAANYVKKGSLIGLVGRLQFEHWTDRNTGSPRMKAVLSTGKFMGPQALRLMGQKRDDSTGHSNGSYDDGNTHQSTNRGGTRTAAATQAAPGTSVRGRGANNLVGAGVNSGTNQTTPTSMTQQPVIEANFDDIPF